MVAPCAPCTFTQQQESGHSRGQATACVSRPLRGRALAPGVGLARELTPAASGVRDSLPVRAVPGPSSGAGGAHSRQNSRSALRREWAATCLPRTRPTSSAERVWMPENTRASRFSSDSWCQEV